MEDTLETDSESPPDPDPEVAEFVRVTERDVEFAVRGIHGDPED